MSLLLADEQPRTGLVEAILAVAAVVGLCSLGCATPPRAHRVRSEFHGARVEARPRVPAKRVSPGRVLETALRARRVSTPVPAAAGDPAAALVTRALSNAGLSFGTDGSMGALWGYVRTSHQLVPASKARAGDVVFFDTAGRQNEAARCADHAGIVTDVAADGRVTFVEARDGQVRESYLHANLPTVRRDPNGRVLNTFLRPKRVSDPPDARVFAGEMVCAVARVRS